MAEPTCRNCGKEIEYRPGPRGQLGQWWHKDGLGYKHPCLPKITPDMLGDKSMHRGTCDEEPNLGLASTRELLEELRARLQFHSDLASRLVGQDVDRALAALTPAQLDYRTVGS